MLKNIYLDHNATTPCDKQVVEAMLPFFSNEFGNPSSPHRMGNVADRACNAAREKIAAFLKCNAADVIFTSGATESNNQILQSLARTSTERMKFVTSDLEHKSILEPCDELRQRGIRVVKLPVKRDGRIDVDAATDLIDERTALVSIQAANNETGVIQPIERIASIAHSKGAFFHCDAAQMVGKLPLPASLGFCDFVSISGHKVYGPKGIGAFIFRDRVSHAHLEPILWGGGQERGLRPGTLNVPAIVGFGKAIEVLQHRLMDDVKKLTFLKERFENSVAKLLPMSWINGANAARLPGTCSLSIPGVPATMLIANLPQLQFGEGSACSSGALAPSHVLLAMGLTHGDADCTIRISFGRQNTLSEVEDAATEIANASHMILEELSERPPIS